MPYDLGDVVLLSVETRDASGTLANAGAMTLTIKKPDQTVETPSYTNPSTGVYQCSYTPATAGPYAVKWVATGANASAYKDAFDVREDFPPMLFSLADARNMLNKASTADNDKIRDLIESTTSIIEDAVGPVIRRTVTEVIRCSGNVPYFVTSLSPIVSVQSIESVLSTGSDLTVADFDVDTNSGIVSSLTGSLFYGVYRVTYIAGRSVVPAAIRDAARLVLKWLWGSQLGPHSGPRDRMKSTPGLPPEARLGRELPQEVTELLRPYIRTGAFA